MNTIWAPWRSEYIVGTKPEGCIFCAAHKEGDKLLITGGQSCLAIMNRFPYTSGHCMIAPIRHIGDVTALSAEESAEMDRLMKALVAAIRKVMNPDGFNIGMNIGAAAGAGIEDHLHLHIVPRWKGDTNFLPVLGEVRLVSQHLETTLERIKEALA